MRRAPHWQWRESTRKIKHLRCRLRSREGGADRRRPDLRMHHADFSATEAFMETVLLLLLAQAALTLAGFVMLWRRVGALRGDIARLSHAVSLLESSVTTAAPQRVSNAAVAGVAKSRVETSSPARPAAPARARAERAWRSRDAETRPTLSANTPVLRRGAIALIALAPALGFLAGLDAALVAACGLVFASVLMTMAWRAEWSEAQWASLAAAALWSIAAFVFRADLELPTALALLGVGAAGLAFAWRRELLPGAALAAIALLTALALSTQLTIIGPIGAVAGGLILIAAILGATSLRLEPLFVGAFIAALIGLFVLSGQSEAAIWFTPAATWMGAAFLAVSAVRTPTLGARGVTFAGIGALAPIAAVTALYAARHGLETPLAAALAYLGVGAALLGVLYWATLKRRLEALGMTAWLLASTAGIAVAVAIAIAAPAPIAASAHAAVALSLMLLSGRAPHLAWRVMACVFALFALTSAFGAADHLLRETPSLPAWAMISAGWALPAALTFAAAYQAQRLGHDNIAASFEVVALGFAMGALHLIVRLLFAGETVLLSTLSFLEAGIHIAIWLAAALLAAWRAREPLRMGASLALSAGALGSCALAALLWLSPFWTARGAPAPLGFILPAFFAGAHWVFWRARGSTLRTHVAFAATALISACALTLWVAHSAAPEWVSALLGALAFAGAIVVNFSPGVTQTPRETYRLSRSR
jgi:hypothetical protein